MNVSDSKFNLLKWYLDCVNDKGEAIIIYAASLKFHGVKVPYNSIIYSTNNQKFIHKSRFRNLSFPKINGNSIIFNDKKYSISGSWKSSANEIHTRLFNSDNGTLDWHCLQPRSKSIVIIGKDNKFEGFGYAENLSLTIEPWKIPMTQLRWGRFTSETDYLVWIEIKSNPIKKWIWHNGSPISNCEISDEKITIKKTGIQLLFTNRRIIESEKKIFNIAKSLLSLIPRISNTITADFLNADETKWLSLGILKQNGIIKSQGWIIHEWVEFGS